MKLSKEELALVLKKQGSNAENAIGYTLFLSGSIEEVEDKGNIVIGIMKDSKKVKTIVSFIGQKAFVTCSCKQMAPDKLCAHSVALLYHVTYSDGDVSKPDFPYVEKMKSSSGNYAEIKNFRLLSKRNIDLLAYDRNSGYSFYGVKITIENVGENFANFKYQSYSYNYQLEAKIEDEKLFLKCSCTKSVQSLCFHQHQMLEHVFKVYQGNFFADITSENIKLKKQEAIKLYGIPEHLDYSKLFDIRFENNALKVIPVGEAAGLVPLGTKNKINLLPNFDTIKSLEKDENFELGWVFCFASEYGENMESFELFPITGKLNKTKEKLINPIRKFDYRNSFDMSISDSDMELMQISDTTKAGVVSGVMNRYRHVANNQGNSPYISKYYANFIERMKALLLSKSYIYLSELGNLSSVLIPVKINTKKVSAFFNLSEGELFYNLDLYLLLGDKEILLGDKEIQYYFPYLIVYQNELYFIETHSDNMLIAENYNSENKVKSLKNNFQAFFNDYIKPISANYPIRLTDLNLEYNKIEGLNMKKQLYLSEVGKFILFKPFVLYENEYLINVLEHGSFMELKENQIFELTRNIDFEKNYLSFLRAQHPHFVKMYTENFLFLEFDEFVKDQWFLTVFEEFVKEDIEVFGLKELTKFKYSQHRAKVRVAISSGEDWFDVHMEVQFGDEYVSLKDIRKAILKREHYVKLADGKLGILPKEWIEKLERYFRQGEIKKDGLKISKLRFNIIEELFDEKDYLEIAHEINQKKRAIREFTEIKDIELPEELKGTLRDYQKSGYHWLHFLDEFKWGGILADDMGLGKTIQILAFLLKQVQMSKLPNLVVMPTTLLFNWQKEIEKFAPSLTFYMYYGNSRLKETSEFNNFNLILTTYGTLTRDAELLSKFKFNYIILDESQAIKNPDSLRFKAVSILKAKNKLALTGTPIENNTFDLYAQMEFLNAGFFGTQTQFKENYSDAIDRDQNPVIASELQRMINPFILRRTKEQVATELPPKIEDFLFCEMQDEQRKVYDAFKNKYRELLLNKIDEEGIGRSKIYVLEGLTKLRQICDSPAILPDEENYGTDSVKIRELLRHIKEKTGKHKILVFSQFVKMLALIEKELKKENVNFEYLDGKSTQKARQESVEHFQNDPNCRVFLISLKAGGTGINLTAADYVYIVDPWWNPAVENQAIDRCYRIGQNKNVIAYRLICANTVEEKIMKYQAKKQKIASDIISTDDAFVKQLDKQDIEDLFS